MLLGSVRVTRQCPWCPGSSVKKGTGLDTLEGTELICARLETENIHA